MGKGLQLALGLCLAFFSLDVISANAQEAPPQTKIASEILLPASTKAWFSVPDYSKLKESFLETEFGRLAKDEKLKPFVDSLSDQAREWFNNQNVRLGIKVEDVQEVRTGEICFAGVLRHNAGQPRQLGRGSHGMVLLIDVTKTGEKAKKLLKKVDKDFAGRDAKRAQFEVNGTSVTKWTVERPKKKVKTRSTYHVVAGGWMVVSDNETVLREIIRRLADIKSLKPAETLASQTAFRSVVENTNVKGVNSHVRWYIDPFGYIELAQAIEREDARKREDDWARILKEEGFGALKGVGGQVSFLTGEHEMLHRTFLYAPRNGANGNQKRFFGLFDFEGRYGHDLQPQDWLPRDVASYFAANWNMSGALSSISGVIDSFMKEEGAMDKVLKQLKAEMNVDVPDLVASFNNQIVVVTSTEKPITESSEQMAICLPLKADRVDKNVLDVIKRALGGEFKLRKFKGNEVLLVEPEEEDDGEMGELDIFEDEDEEEESGEEEAEEFQLFEKKFITISNKHLIICNNEDFLKRILSKSKKTGLKASTDYVQVKQALEKIVDPSKISFRQFGRIDKSMETNYEMLRKGRMGVSKTMLARVVNRILTPAEDPDVIPDGLPPRKQKLDGSKLPADYDKFVAPYFGPMGWVFETTPKGWRLTGCMLKKNANELVRKPDSSAATR